MGNDGYLGCRLLGLVVTAPEHHRKEKDSHSPQIHECFREGLGAEEKGQWTKIANFYSSIILYKAPQYIFFINPTLILQMYYNGVLVMPRDSKSQRGTGNIRIRPPVACVQRLSSTVLPVEPGWCFLQLRGQSAGARGLVLRPSWKNVLAALCLGFIIYKLQMLIMPLRVVVRIHGLHQVWLSLSTVVILWQ